MDQGSAGRGKEPVGPRLGQMLGSLVLRVTWVPGGIKQVVPEGPPAAPLRRNLL